MQNISEIVRFILPERIVTNIKIKLFLNYYGICLAALVNPAQTNENDST